MTEGIYKKVFYQTYREDVAAASKLCLHKFLLPLCQKMAEGGWGEERGLPRIQ